jgi:LacI family transcriptional regulator
MKRVGMNELVRETGLSRATIDRALNGRSGVHKRTKQVIEATLVRLRELEVPQDTGETAVPGSTRPADLVLRLGRGLMEQIRAARGALGYEALDIHDMHQRSESDILEIVRALCYDPERPLILTAKNVEPLRAELVNARKRGKLIIAFVSDLSHDARDAFVGIDNRNAGQTAAFVLGALLRHRHATAGVVLGDYAFRCHEDREIGFRANLRANFPTVQVADVAKGEDSPERTYEAVRDLLNAHPKLDAIYNVAGGNLGLAQAIRESGRAGAIEVMTHETNYITAPLIREGIVHYSISQNPAELLRTAMTLAGQEANAGMKELHLVDFGVYTSFNLPSYSATAMMRTGAAGDHQKAGGGSRSR